MVSTTVAGLVGSASLVAATTSAFAHTGVGATSGFAHGFMHPIGGLDHVLAMVMVGMLAGRMGGRATLLVPAAFVTVMMIGGTLGVAGMPLPFVETGIALSVLVLGGMVALGIQAPVAVAMGIVGVFAMFHGHAHGAEMPETASGLAYGGGFVAATILLHAAGVGLGHLSSGAAKRGGLVYARAAGGLSAVAGVAMLVGNL
ncbi:HupE/UreJ family protein [Hartmannibacter diazotrophicus]|uniref:HupE/UreJ family protein n=1 Tax=Hartmannibacter diazotrophicus TaxID=1482074 RepID=UPI003CCBFA43